MATYRVIVSGKEVAQYADFQRHGHSGVRGRGCNARTEEYAGPNAYLLAQQTAEDLARGCPGAVTVVREDGTVAVTISGR